MTRLAEPEWDQASRDLVLAHAQVAECPICHGDPQLCQDPARQYDWQVPAPVRCHATTALREAQDRFRKDQPEGTEAHLDALQWHLSLNDSTAAAAG